MRDRNGFLLSHPPRNFREFTTATGRANLIVNELGYPEVPEERLLLRTLRSHDQYNTTVYGTSDRHRGIENARRVVMVHADDLVEPGLEDGQHVDLISEWTDGGTTQRRAEELRVVEYPTARGCAAARADRRGAGERDERPRRTRAHNRGKSK